MNILFALYHDFTSNSAGHVRSLANELTQLGHECAVAVPNNKASINNLGPVQFRPIEFSEALQQGFSFSDGRGPDLIHAWTPRELVRKFCGAMRKVHNCHFFVHMEDNEWHLVSCALGQPFEQLARLDPEQLDEQFPDTLAHPHRALDFLAKADGVTVIIDSLRDLLPPVKATLELWPSADEQLFTPRPRQPNDRRALGIPKNSTAVIYTGNVHAANAHEVRSLYLAIAILNREGHPATLVRAGRDYYPFLGPDETWGRQHSIELGLVPHTEVSALLSLADVLVQPGRADKFNDYRFPSKLPEFLSAGRPVILPATNIARHMQHRKHGFILYNSGAIAIADAIKEIMSDGELYERLSTGALEFFKERLSWSISAKKLNEFYIDCISRATSTAEDEPEPLDQRLLRHTAAGAAV